MLLPIDGRSAIHSADDLSVPVTIWFIVTVEDPAARALTVTVYWLVSAYEMVTVIVSPCVIESSGIVTIGPG